MSKHLSWAAIDLGAIRHNFSQVKKCARGVKILAAVKANAYGHGMKEVAKALEKCNVDYLGVAFVDEGIELRKAGCKVPILVLSNALPYQAKDIVKYRLTASVSDTVLARAISREAVRTRKKAKLHIKVDTGMGRLGIRAKDAILFAERVFHFPGITVEGIFTHLPSADEKDRSFTKAQITRFKRVITSLEKEGYVIPIRHAANSAGVKHFPDSFFNMVRPGLMLYGLDPSPLLIKSIKLKPALSLKTRIVFLKDVPHHTPVSYGRTYVTKTRTRIGVLPIGYADGYSRSLSNIGEVLVHGKRCKVIGRICMDHTVIDLKGAQVKAGDEVVLIGRSGKEEITAQDIAEKTHTISYEIVSRIGPRIPRVFK